MSKPYHIVLTTINVPRLLADYHQNILIDGFVDDVTVWVIADLNTPKEAAGFCAQLRARGGLDIRYVDVAEQDAWGQQFEGLYKRIPYKNETRRNLGYLMALEDGCETLISIDDDNWPTAEPFVKGHSRCGAHYSGGVIEQESGFYNVCQHLVFDNPRDVFPRGYPFKLRSNQPDEQRVLQEEQKEIGVVAGLWLDSPDVDATTWLNGPVTGLEYTGPDSFVLSQSTWSPINTQNTSVVRELIPAYMCIPMGWDVPGGKIQRYGDIWGGYILQAAMMGTDYLVSFGQPVVDHRRNPHDYLTDLRCEYWGMILTDWLLEKLKNDFRSSSSGISSRVDDVASFLEVATHSDLPGWAPDEMKLFLLHTSENLKMWVKTCNQIGI